MLRNILSIKRSASSGVIEMCLLRLQYKTQFRNVLCQTPVSLLWHPHAIYILPKYPEKLYIDRKKTKTKKQASDVLFMEKTLPGWRRMLLPENMPEVHFV